MYKIASFIKIFILTSLIFWMNNSFSANTEKNKFISYTDAGQGKPLVLIHAFPTDKGLWHPQQKLQQHFRVITLDLWGFGQSASVSGQAVTMSDYADELKKLLDQLNIKRAIVGGESMGGYIALAFLEKYPEHVEGLILSDTQSIADTPEAKAKREAAAIDVLEHGTENLINGFMPKALSSHASEQTKIFLRNMLDGQSPAAVASALRGMAVRNDTSVLLTKTALPILIITGDTDMLIPPQQSQNMHIQAKNSKLVTIENAGHLSSLEQPEQWNRAVVEMFNKNLN